MTFGMIAHCWKDSREHAEEVYGNGSPEHLASLDEGGATCMLRDGHDGEHEFTPDDEILITFPPDRTN